MSALKFVFSLAILFYSANRILAVSVERQATDNANDFFFGNRTAGSVLLHSERIIVNGISDQYVNGTLQWSTRGIIEEVNAIDMNRNGSGGHVQNYTIYYFSASLTFKSTVLGAGIDFTVFIYGERPPPNHYIRGELSDISVLAQHSHVPRVVGSTVLNNVYFYGRNISRVEAIDRNANGTGGMLLYSIGRITENYMALYFYSEPGNSIDFDVKFYVDASNDLFIGDEYDTTILLSASRITASGIPGEIVQNITEVISSNYTIGMINAMDISEAHYGARMNITSGGVGQSSISISFASSAPGRNLDYVLAIYANAIEGVNNFRFGTYRHGDMLLHREHFVVQAPTNGTAYGDLEFNGSHIISMFQGIDQNWNGSRLVTVSYGQGSNHTVLSFRAMTPGLDINFLVDIYGQ